MNLRIRMNTKCEKIVQKYCILFLKYDGYEKNKYGVKR